MKQIVIDYEPTEKQAIFHATTANEVLYGGAAGGGKSKAIVMDAFARCMKYPGTSAYIFRRTYRELEDTIIKEAMASIPLGAGIYNVGRREHKLINGSTLYYRHCATPADMYTYSGAEIHWLYIDELTTFEREIYDFLKTRLRAKKSLGIVPVVRCSSNPGNIGHAWVKAYFVDAGSYMAHVVHEVKSQALGDTHTFTTQYIPSLAIENPHITRDYIRELDKKPPALRRALLNGDWDAFEGQVFPEFTDNPAHYDDRLGTHVIKPFEIPLHWARYMGFDFGFSRPFSVGWWAVAPDGVIYRYREWYGWTGSPNEGQKLTPRQISQGILEREEEEAAEGIVFQRLADPSIFDVSRGESIAQLMSNLDGHGRGVSFREADNARMAGQMQLHERLRFDERGKPRLYVFDTCKQFIRTIPNLPFDTNKPEDVDSDSEDHVFDECRYVLMARPLPINTGFKPRKKPFDPLEDDS